MTLVFYDANENRIIEKFYFSKYDKIENEESRNPDVITIRYKLYVIYQHLIDYRNLLSLYMNLI